MTPRERLLAVLRGDVPDCVPVAPDFSNMIPARLTGKPFWDLYLYRDPPVFEAYIDCARHFDIDAVMDGYFPYDPAPPKPKKNETRNEWERFIVLRTDERIVTQRSRVENGTRVWRPFVDVYYVADPPTGRVPVEKLGLPAVPEKWEKIEGVREIDRGVEGLRAVKERMGDQGLVGVGVTSTLPLGFSENAVYRYFDHPEKHEEWARNHLENAERGFDLVMSQEVLPDFLCLGSSGTLVFQSVEMFRKLALPAIKRVTRLAADAGMPTHVHSCGPEKELVKIMVEETDLTVIDPLEIPPMGNCDLAELKRLYGDRITLKGNLHTTEVMLRGTADDVRRASREAIDDAAEGGRFILSTGDQCGRDTPDENLRAMVETARGYGRY